MRKTTQKSMDVIICPGITAFRTTSPDMLNPMMSSVARLGTQIPRLTAGLLRNFSVLPGPSTERPDLYVSCICFDDSLGVGVVIPHELGWFPFRLWHRLLWALVCSLLY